MTRIRALAPAGAIALLALTGCPRPRPMATPPASPLEEAGISATLPAQLDSMMAASIADHASTGITIAIGRPGVDARPALG